MRWPRAKGARCVSMASVIFQHSTGPTPLDVVIKLDPPRTSQMGYKYGVTIDVWPIGQHEPGIGHMFSLDPDEAQQLGEALCNAAREAREIYGDRVGD